MKYLIVVDMQNDFIDGSLGTKEAVDIVEKVCNKIKRYKQEGYTILATRDTHFGEDDCIEEKRYSHTQEGRKLPVLHCVRDTKGWEIHSEVKEAMGEVKIFDKYTFGSEELSAYMKKENPEEIELIGLCTDICVVSNGLLLKAALPEVSILVDGNCCAGVTPESHQAALRTMSMCQIEVI